MIVEACHVPTNTALRWELRIGATVYATDDVIGKLSRVVIAPGQQKVVGLIVHGGLPVQERLIPIEAVQQADDEQIQLCWSHEEILLRGRFESAHFHTLERSIAGFDPGLAAIPLKGGVGQSAAENAVPIEVGLEVVALDGDVGKVSRVLVNAGTDRIMHFVVHEGVLIAPARIVPASWVSSVTSKVVTLAVTRAEVSMLPVYLPDDEITGKILDVWMHDPIIDALLVVSDIRVTVTDSIAVLNGYTRTCSERCRLEELAEGAPGVLGIRNHVLSDEDLAEAVFRALCEDPRTQGRDIQVQSYLGKVHLLGTVPDRETREAAAEAAMQVPRVDDIVNLLEVSGE